MEENQISTNSTIFYHILQFLLYSTIFYCILPYSTVFYHILLYSTIFCCILPHSTTFYHILPYSTVFYHILPLTKKNEWKNKFLNKQNGKNNSDTKETRTSGENRGV